ncbi:MAG: hypothetical protein ACRDYY_10645 [Acidimicrobiales bacterium]
MGDSEQWRRSEAALWRMALDDVVVLAPWGEEPFALAGGAALWSSLAEPRTVCDLVGRLAPDGAAPETGGPGDDVRRLLAELERSAAVERVPPSP